MIVISIAKVIILSLGKNRRHMMYILQETCPSHGVWLLLKPVMSPHGSFHLVLHSGQLWGCQGGHPALETGNSGCCPISSAL